MAPGPLSVEKRSWELKKPCCQEQLLFFSNFSVQFEQGALCKQAKKTDSLLGRDANSGRERPVCYTSLLIAVKECSALSHLSMWKKKVSSKMFAAQKSLKDKLENTSRGGDRPWQRQRRDGKHCIAVVIRPVVVRGLHSGHWCSFP